MHYVGASTTTKASRQQVWDFIKPPENSVLFDANVVRAFRAPGPEGEGEIQVFISVCDGVETVTAIEVVQGISQKLAVTRSIGDSDVAARGRDFLRDGEDGTTVFEHGSYFTLPPEAAGHLPRDIDPKIRRHIGRECIEARKAGGSTHRYTCTYEEDQPSCFMGIQKL